MYLFYNEEANYTGSSCLVTGFNTAKQQTDQSKR